MYKSPGPCYSLPGLVGSQHHDPRSVHTKDPSWPFGIRHGKFSDDASPGPIYYPDVRTTNHGKDGTPVYSLHSRTKDMTPFNVPAPGTYSPEKVGPSASPRAPHYSFGSRTKLRATDKNPSPNNYTLPSLLGKTLEGDKKQAPCFSLTGRSKVGSFSEDLQRTPGPGTYGTTEPGQYQRKAPLYSMLGRNMMPGDSTTKPGPGAHSPERVVINKRSAPNPSFGIRHSEYTTPLIIDCV